MDLHHLHGLRVLAGHRHFLRPLRRGVLVSARMTPHKPTGGRPDDIPQDVWDAAQDAVLGDTGDMDFDISLAIARTVMAERERCANACNAFDAPVSDSDFVHGQATAAQQIRSAIRGGE